MTKVTDKFNRYIRLIFRDGLPGYIIREDGIDWVNDRIVEFIHQLVSESMRFMHTAHPPRVSLLERDVEASLQVLLPDIMRRLAETYMNDRLTQYDENKEVRNKTERAGLRVAIGRCAIHIRRGLPNHQLRHRTFIMVASVIEYLISEFLDCIKEIEEGEEVMEVEEEEVGDDGGEEVGEEEEEPKELTLEKIQSVCRSDTGLSSVFGSPGLLS